jgi:hypothetical protein
MATKIKHKRSSVPGKKPTIQQLESGEIAINTADGKAFLLKDDNTVQDLTKEIFENDTKITIDDASDSTQGIISAVVDGAEQIRVTESSTQLQNTVEIEDANEIRFKELTASGQNYVGIKAPDNLLNNYTLNLPPTQGTLGQLLSSSGTGFLDWVDADIFSGNSIYVSSEKGDDTNDGINAPVRTVKRALQIASGFVYNPNGSPNDRRVAVQVAAGDYTEDNPIIVPDNVVIRGTGLRACIIRPGNANRDMLRVRNGCYFAEFTFRDGVDSNFVPSITADYSVAFDDPSDTTVDRSGYTNLPNTKPTITTSPYIQNCSIISFLGMNGAKLDGNKVRSPNTPFRQIEAENPVEGSAPEQGKSMVANAFTHISFGGTGWRLTNDAYAQLVSCFQIFLLNGVYTQSGGYVSITNSATNFGLYALRSSGYSRNAFTFDRAYVVGSGISQGRQTLSIVGIKRNEPINEFVLRFREPDYKIQFDLLQSAKDEIVNDTIDWIDAQISSAPPSSIWENFTYNTSLYETNLKIIIDAVSQDVWNTGNSFSIQAGLSYVSGFEENQELQTIAAIEYARDEALTYITTLDSEVRASVAEKFDIITTIIDDPGAAPEPIPVSSQGDITNSFKSIGAEKEFDAATDISEITNTITIVNHGLSNSQAIIYDPNGNPEIPGLDAEQTYYAIVVNDDEFRLAFDESLDFEVNVIGTSTGTHKFLTNVVEFFVKEIVNSHQTFQTLILDSGQGDLNFVPGRLINGITGTSNVSAYVYSWQPLQRRLVVSINLVTVGPSELRVLFDNTSTINADHSTPANTNLTIESTAIRSDIGSATFTIEGIVDGAELTNLGNIVEQQIWFHRPSIVNSSAHTWEYAGSGIDYNALPQNGGNTREQFEQFSEIPGRVYSSGTNELGDFKVGDFITAFNRTGNITFRNRVQVEELDALRLSVSDVVIEEISTDVGLGENEIGGPSNSRLSTQRAIRQFLSNRLGGFIDKAVSTAAVPGAIVQLNTNGQLNDDLIPSTRSFRSTNTNGYLSRLLQVDEIPAVDLSAGDIATENYQQVELTLNNNITSNNGDLITQPSSGAEGYSKGNYNSSLNILIASIDSEFIVGDDSASTLFDNSGTLFINGVDTGITPTSVGLVSDITENFFLRSSVESQYLILDPNENYVFTNALISTAARTSNVSTIVTTAPHLLQVGNQIRVRSEDDPTYNETGKVLSVPSSTSFTYSNPGSNSTINTITGTVNSVVTAADGDSQGEITELRLGVLTNVDNANIVSGTGYTPTNSTQVYEFVPLTSVTGIGTGAIADITVANGSVTDVDLRRGGINYAVGDILSVSAGNVGGTGSGFEIEVLSIEKRAYVNILGGELFVASPSSIDLVEDNVAAKQTIDQEDDVLQTFDSRATGSGGDVDYTNSRITINNHGFENGDPVIYNNGGNVNIGGLLNNIVYYVRKINDNIIEINDDYALISKAIFVSTPTGIHTLQRKTINTIDNSVFAPAHGYITGDAVRIEPISTATLFSIDGDEIRPGSRFFVGSITTNSFTLHTLRSDALSSINGLVINARDITDGGLGSIELTRNNVRVFGVVNTSSQNQNNWNSLAVTNIDASNIISGTISPSRLGASGTANTETFLRGDSSYQPVVQKLAKANTTDNPIVLNGLNVNEQYFGDPVTITIQNANRDVGNAFSTLGTSRFLQSQFDVATDGSGAVFIKDNVIDAGTLQGLNSAFFLNPNNLSSPVPVSRGGTNITTYAVGDIIFAQTTGSLGTLGIGRSNSVITSTGTNPRWNTKLDMSEDIGTKGGRVFTANQGTAKLFNEAAQNVEIAGAAGSVRIGNNADTRSLTDFVAAYDATTDQNVAVILVNFNRNTNSNVGNNSNELSFANTADILVGMIVSGSASLPSNTVVTGVSGNFVYISNNTTGTISTATAITFTHTPESIGVRAGDTIIISGSGITNLDGTFPVSGATADASSFTIRADDVVTANPANPKAGTVLKQNATIIKNRRIVLGGSSASPNPTTAIIRGEDGIGTNVVGGSISIQPGIGRGNAQGGDFVVITGERTTSGSVRHTPTTRLTIDTQGKATFTGEVGIAGTISTNQTTVNVLNTIATTANVLGAATALTIGATTGTATIRNATTTLTGNANINGGTLGTNQTAFNLLNTTATTVNAFGAGTNITVGATSGTTTVRNSLTVNGDLTVLGDSTIIQAATLQVEDKNIELGVVVSPTNTTADGGGITLKGTTDKTINWINATGKWTSSEDFNLANGKAYFINNQPVLNSNTLGANIVNSSLTSVGTISSGVWQGTVISPTYGGTGVNNGSRTLTLGGNLQFSGAFNTTVTVTGATSVTLPTSGTLARTQSGLNQFASTTSAQLAGVISDETGTGVLVFNASPSFTTAVNTGSASFNVFNITATTVNAFGASTALTIGATTGTATIRNATTTLTGNANVNGGTLATTATTFNLINTTATTVNAFGASTALTIGATTGTATIRNANVVLSGDLDVRGGDLITNQTTFNLLNNTATTINFGGAATTLNVGANTSGAKVVIRRDLEVTNDLLISGILNVGSINNTPIGNITPSTGAFTALTANGLVTFTNNTSSTNTGTGALVVTGGVGIGGTLNATTINGSINAANIDNGTLPNARIAVTGVTQHQGSITGTGVLNSGSINTGFGNINIGTSTFTGNGSGLTTLNATNLSSGTVSGARLGGNQSMAGVKTFTDTSAATSTITGAVRIGGGLGVAGAIHAATFHGNGAAVTNIAGGNIATGTINDARLPTSQTGKTFTSDITVHSHRFGRGNGNISSNIVAGGGAGISTGTDNSAFGVGALNAAVTGNFNTGVGRNSLTLLTSSQHNTGIGYNALSQIATTTGRNTTVGSEAMQNGVTANDNVAVGYQALEIANSNENVVIGALAGRTITSGNNNIAIGYNAQITSNTTSNEIVLGNASHNNLRVPGVALTASTTTLTFSGATGFAGVGTSLTALNASQLTSGTIPNARIAQTGVTQHQGSITGTGVLNSGSINTGFGNINIGTSTFTGNGSGLTTLNATNLSSGTVAGARLGGNQSMAGIKTFTDTSAATSTITGAVRVTGGVGIVGNLYVGGILSASGANLTNLNANNLTSGTVPNARLTGTYSGITGTGVLNAGSINTGFGNINIGTSTFTGNGSGLTTLNATNLSSGTVPNARLSGSYTGITGTGALNAGSISSGFSNINIGTSTFTGNGSGLTTLNATNLSSGTVAGARLGGNQSMAGVKTFTDTSAASSTTSGAVRISGGLGVAGAIYAATFHGNGAAVTNIAGGNIATGTINDARLPTSQTGKTFTSDITVHSHRFGRGNGNISSNIVAGGGAGISTGTDNSAFGVGALNAAVTGNFNTGVGRNALALLTSSAHNTSMGYNALSQISTTAGRNTTVGSEAMQNSVTANDNVAVGYQALEIANSSQNVMIGSLAGRNITNGANNIAIGYNAQVTASTTSNEIVLGTASHNNFRIPGVALTASTTTLTFSGATGFAGVGTSLTALNASQLTSGTVPDARIAQTSVTQHQLAITGTGVLNAGSINTGFGNINIGTSTFTGNGSGLTTLNASNLSTGTVAGARLGGNQSMAGIKTFTDTSAAISTTTGAVRVTGGVGIAGNLYVGGVLSASGANLTNLNANNLTTGTVPNARISGTYSSLTGTGVLNAGSINTGFGNINIGTSTFTGNGSGLTTLNATNLSSGTVADARLSTNVVLLSGTQTITGVKTFNANLTLGTAASLFFGSATRQMVNLYSNSYGIGVQSGTQYYRSGSRFSWFRGGVHNNTENAPGTGGAVAMTLDGSSNLTVTGNVNATAFTGNGAGLTGVTIANSVTFNNGGAGAASGTTFNGSAAVTVSWNTIAAVTTNNTAQTVAGLKTFSTNPRSSAAQGTNATDLTRRDFVTGLDAANVKLTGNQTISGIKTFSQGTNSTTTTNGSIVISGSGGLGVGGNVNIGGVLSATAKSFLIDHPTKPGQKLQYGSLESPYHGVRLTGEGVITKDTVTVDLPDYIHGLCKQEGAQVQITNIKHGKVIWVEDVDVDNDKFTVALDRGLFDSKEYRFFWSFTAIRKDIKEMIVEVNNE